MTHPTVLIVDDEPHMLRLTSFCLKKGGFRILTAQSGLQAIATAQRELPAVVVLDLVLGDMDGIETLRSLRALPETAHIPAIILTSQSPETREGAPELLGAAVYMTKPFSPSRLLEEVQRLTAGR